MILSESEELDREKFFKWLNTCPSKGDTGWLIVEDEFGRTNVDFFYEEEEFGGFKIVNNKTENAHE